MKAAKEEFLAVVKLLNRSSVSSIPNNYIARNLSTSLRLFEKQQDGKASDDSKKEQMQKSPSNDNKPNEEQNKQSNRNDDEKRKKDKKTIEDKDRMNKTQKALAYMTKAILWICLIYSISFTILVVTSILQGGNGGARGDVETYTVSWKEFVQYMLAAGEVREIVIRPQYDYVRIVLHDGAVVNGRRPRFSSYMLSVPNVERFEERLRQVEKSMGIAEGIQIVAYLTISIIFNNFQLIFVSRCVDSL